MLEKYCSFGQIFVLLLMRLLEYYTTAKRFKVKYIVSVNTTVWNHKYRLCILQKLVKDSSHSKLTRPCVTRQRKCEYSC